MEYMKRGNCPVDVFISAIYPPEEAQQALGFWAKDPAKVFRIFIKFAE